MTDADLWAAWRLWLAVGAVLVVVAAALLIAILLVARRILAEAARALAAAETIQKNTAAIWELQGTNDVAAGILETVEAIERKGGALVQALQAEHLSRRQG